MSVDRWTQKFLNRLRIGQFLQTSAEWLGIFFLSFGTIVLLVKLTLPMLWPYVLWLGLGAFPIAAAAWVYSQRDSFTPCESVAYLDRKLNAGGLLMTLSEAPDGEWQQQLPQMETLWRNSLPRFRPVRFAKLVLIPALFSLACGFIPLREYSEDEPLLNQTAREKNVEELKAQFEQLKEEEILDKEETERMEQEIKQLLADKNDPLTHEKWETVDALWEKMQLRVDQRAVAMSKARAAAATLSKSMGGDGDPLTPEQWQELAKQIEAGMSSFSGEGRTGTGKLSGKLGDLMKNGKLNLPGDPKELQQTLADLQDLLEAEEKKLCELRGQCQGCKNGQCQGTSLADMLADCNKPGRGGVTRGRGDASLNYGHETDEQGVKFKETVLPKGFLDEPNNDVITTTLAPPKEEIAEDAPRTAARQSDPSTGKETWNRKISPRYRSVVKDYFDAK